MRSLIHLLHYFLSYYSFTAQLEVLKCSDIALKSKIAVLEEELAQRMEETNSLCTALQVCVCACMHKPAVHAQCHYYSLCSLQIK